MKNRVAPALLIVMLAACGGSETSTPTTESVSEALSEAKKEVEKARRERGKAEIDPCTVLDEKLVRSHLDVGEAAVSFRLSSSTRHPLCAASWPKPDAEQIKRDMQAKMTEYMTAAARGEKVDMPSFKLENEVSLTLNSPSFASAEEAAGAYDSAMRLLEQGVRDKNNPDAPPQFQYETHSVAGVGDRASWAPGLNQISVQSGRHVFHVRVAVGDRQVNQETAKAMASEIAAKLPK